MEEALESTRISVASTPSERKDLISEVEPWAGRPLFVTLEGETRRVSVDIEGLPRAVVTAIKRHKAMVISPARYPKDEGGNYVKATIPLSDGTKYELTLTSPVCWVRAPGDRERALVWGLRSTGSLTSANHTGDYLIIPRDRAGTKAWVPKTQSKRDRNKREPREAFKAYPVATETLIEWLTAELAFTKNAFDGHQRCRSSWLLLTEENHAIHHWRSRDDLSHDFVFHWERGE